MDICFSLVVIRGVERGVERGGGWVGACGVVFYSSRLDGAHFSCFFRYPLFSLHVATTLTMLFYYVVILSLFWIIVEVGGGGLVDKRGT